MYSSKPQKGGIYRSHTWASRWASIHGLTYTPTINKKNASYKFIHRQLELLLNGKLITEDEKLTLTIIPPSKISAASAYKSTVSIKGQKQISATCCNEVRIVFVRQDRQQKTAILHIKKFSSSEKKKQNSAQNQANSNSKMMLQKHHNT